jgi:hypothetical protein
MISYTVYRKRSEVENLNGNMKLNFYNPELFQLNKVLIPPGTDLKNAKINQNLEISCDEDKKNVIFWLQIHKTEINNKIPFYIINTHFKIKKKEMDNLIKYINHKEDEEESGIDCAIGFKETVSEKKRKETIDDITERLSYDTFNFDKFFDSENLQFEITFKIGRINYIIKS